MEPTTVEEIASDRFVAEVGQNIADTIKRAVFAEARAEALTNMLERERQRVRELEEHVERLLTPPEEPGPAVDEEQPQQD